MTETPALSAGAIALIVLIVLAGGAASGYIYLHSRPAPAHSVLVVLEGDNATVNYIGVFGSGPDDGKVFDTSLYSVATNGAVWPKSLEYSPRASAANYTPLPVHVGSGQFTLGGVSYLSVVTGFWQGLLGLAGNASRAITVPENLGYGPENPGCIVTRPLVQQFPVLESLTRTQFTTAYPGTIPNNGVTFQDPHYGWTVLVLSSNATSVTIENLAKVGDSGSPAGWPVVVTNVTATANGSGVITAQNQLVPAQAGHLLGNDFAGTGPCSSQSGGHFIVSAVNLATGTYTEDFNSEVTGQTLIFIVTIVDIFPPGAGA